MSSGAFVCLPPEVSGGRLRATLHWGMRRNKLFGLFVSTASGGVDVSRSPWVAFSREPPELDLRRFASAARRLAALPPSASGCCRRFSDSPPEVFRRFLLVPQAVNFQWWQFLHGGSAEFFGYGLRKIRRTVNHSWVCIPGNLRGSWALASGASVILKIWILSRA